MMSEEKVSNNAAIRLWIIVTTVIVLALFITIYYQRPRTEVVVPAQRDTVVVPAPVNPPPGQ